MKFPGTIAAAAAFALISMTAQAQEGLDLLTEPMELQIGHDHTQIMLVWDHVGVTDTLAVIRSFEGKVHLDPQSPENSTVSITMDMNSIDSFFEPRDKVLKSERFLNVAAYPEASFESTSVTPTGAITADIAGDFTFMGQTHPITLAAEFNKAATNMGETVVGFTARTELDRGDMGVTDIYPRVAPKIAVQVEAELAPAE